MMRVEIYKEDSREKIGFFYVPNNASKEWLERNIPRLIHAAQLMVDETEPWEKVDNA